MKLTILFSLFLALNLGASVYSHDANANSENANLKSNLQQVSISGTITDAETGEALPGAMLSLEVPHRVPLPIWMELLHLKQVKVMYF